MVNGGIRTSAGDADLTPIRDVEVTVDVMLSDDPVAMELLSVYGEVFPGEAIDISLIVTVITSFIQVIQQCRQSREQTQRMVHRKHRRARVAAFSAVRRDFPEKSRREQWALANEILDRAASKPELLDELADDAYAVCTVT